MYIVQRVNHDAALTTLGCNATCQGLPWELHGLRAVTGRLKSEIMDWCVVWCIYRPTDLMDWCVVWCIYRPTDLMDWCVVWCIYRPTDLMDWCVVWCIYRPTDLWHSQLWYQICWWGWEEAGCWELKAYEI